MFPTVSRRVLLGASAASAAIAVGKVVGSFFPFCAISSNPCRQLIVWKVGSNSHPATAADIARVVSLVEKLPWDTSSSQIEFESELPVQKHCVNLDGLDAIAFDIGTTSRPAMDVDLSEMYKRVELVGRAVRSAGPVAMVTHHVVWVSPVERKIRHGARRLVLELS